MRSVNDSVETINAAATAIVSAEARAQPTTVPKRRWSSCWSLYWCFGTQKNSKRIGHAVLVPEPTLLPGVPVTTTESHPPSTAAIILPFIAPPSSPVSFLQSDPSSATQSPAKLLSLTSLSINNAYSSDSSRGPPSIFAIGPYAYETQLVSPPVFSTLTTEPSTAPFTPPPESVHLTTPSSPEVPFAQLLSSSRRNNGSHHQKFSLSHCEFQPYQTTYPGSPGGNLISPGSVVSNSGTSSPFPEKQQQPVLGFRSGEAPRLLGFEHFTARKWGSRLGSGSLTPDGYGLGLGSRLGSSGCLTPNCPGLGSGSLTPNGLLAVSGECSALETRISEVSENGCQNDGPVVDHRVSFELTGEDVARCLASKSGYFGYLCSDSLGKKDTAMSTHNGDKSEEATSNGVPENNDCRKPGSINLGSIKEFNFDNMKSDVAVKPSIGSEWWANEKVAGKEQKAGNSWSFFPILQPGVS